jgi:allantoicase
VIPGDAGRDPSGPSGPAAPAAFERRVNLASARVGAVALGASDEFFAPMARLVRDAAPVWRADRYTDRGKWMDGWETRRRRTPGHDWCVIRLGLAGHIHGVVVDTSHFTGNFPESCSLEACDEPADTPLERLTDPGCPWIEILPRTPLAGDTRHRFAISSPWRFSHVRLSIHPDGGVARLRVHGEPVPEPGALRTVGGLVDLAALAHGAEVVAASDEFFGSRHHLILRGRSRGMADGWETRRRRGPGRDWAVLRLATEGVVRRAVVDTAFFKGNAPGRVTLDLAGDPAALEAGALEGPPWLGLLAAREVRPDARHVFRRELADAGAARVARLAIEPDGGVARLRLYGTPTAGGRAELGMRWLNALPPAAAAAVLRACVGSGRWVERIARARPFADPETLIAAAEGAAEGLGRQDWLECFALHPRIGGEAPRPDGGLPSAGGAGAREGRFSAEEQSASRETDSETRRALAEGNRRYEERFGHVFLIAAAGRGAREILAELERRSALPAAEEFANAVREERRIAARRLQRLVTGEEGSA